MGAAPLGGGVRSASRGHGCHPPGVPPRVAVAAGGPSHQGAAGIAVGRFTGSCRPDPSPSKTGEVVAALRDARDEALRFVASLDDAEIERLRAAEIDGEPNALMATCGLIGHWTFHFPAIQQIRGVSA